jgi:hypothetical protein
VKTPRGAASSNTPLRSGMSPREPRRSDRKAREPGGQANLEEVEERDRCSPLRAFDDDDRGQRSQKTTGRQPPGAGVRELAGAPSAGPGQSPRDCAGAQGVHVRVQCRPVLPRAVSGSTRLVAAIEIPWKSSSGRRDLNPRRPPWQEGGRQSGSGEKPGECRSGCPPGRACGPPAEPADRCDGRCDRPLAGVQWCTDRRGAFAVCGTRSRLSIAAPKRRSERSRVAGVARPRLTPARRVHGAPARLREALRQRPNRARRACASLNANEGTMS